MTPLVVKKKKKKKKKKFKENKEREDDLWMVNCSECMILPVAKSSGSIEKRKFKQMCEGGPGVSARVKIVFWL